MKLEEKEIKMTRLIKKLARVVMMAKLRNRPKMKRWMMQSRGRTK